MNPNDPDTAGVTAKDNGILPANLDQTFGRTMESSRLSVLMGFVVAASLVLGIAYFVVNRTPKDEQLAEDVLAEFFPLIVKGNLQVLPGLVYERERESGCKIEARGSPGPVPAALASGVRQDAQAFSEAIAEEGYVVRQKQQTSGTTYVVVVVAVNCELGPEGTAP